MASSVQKSAATAATTPPRSVYLQTLHYTLFALLLSACYTAVHIFVFHWSRVTHISASDFKRSDFNFIREIPTTYYESGQLGKVMPEWDHRFHLYRVKDADKYAFDVELLNSTVVARKLDSSCQSLPNQSPCKLMSTMSVNCMFDKHDGEMVEDLIDARTIFTDEGKGYYASFAKIMDHNVVAGLWNTLHLPFSVDTTQFEHAFLSNLEKNEITASFHANPMTLSMAIQFEGRKTWIFLPDTTFRDSMKATFAGSALFVKNSPARGATADLYMYTSEPGDVLFFPESWGHAVYTYKGPSVMVNYRKMVVGNFLRQPITWLEALIGNLFFKKLTNQGKAAQAIKDQKIMAVPSNKLNMYVQDMFDKMCEAEGQTEFDKQMLEFIADEVKKY